MVRKLLFIMIALGINLLSFGQLNEDFEGTFPPSGWTVIDNDGGSSMNEIFTYISAYSGTQGVQAMGCYDDYLITPKLTVSAGDNTLSYWTRVESSSYPYSFEIMISTTGTAIGDFTQIADYPGFATASWTNLVEDLSAYNGSNVYVAFHVYSAGATYYDFGFDLITGPTIFIPACPAPTDIQASNITTNSADLSWTSGASLFNVKYNADSDFDPNTEGTAVSPAPTTNSCSLTSLTSATTYYWYVQADCGTDEVSAWTGPETFTTACEAFTTFPFFEDFEGTFLPSCWTKIVHSGNDITQSSTENHTAGGIYSARFSSFSSSSDYNQYLFSPPVTIDAAYTQLSFWHKKHNSTETLEWGIATTTDPNDYTWTAVSLSSTEWQETVVDLSGYIGQTVYIGFHYYGNFAYYVYLDDVNIDVAPSCPAPTDLTTTSITPSGADLEWTSVDSFFDIYVIPTGDPAPDAGTTPTADDVSNPYTWSGGMAASTYDWYVRTDCGQNNIDVSDWSGPETFTTSCIAVSEFSEDFDGVSTPDFPACWAKVGTSGSAYTSTSYSNSSPNGLYMYGYDVTATVSLPEVTNAGDGTHRLRLQARANYTIGGVLEAGYLTDPMDDATFVTVTSATMASTTFQEYVLDLGTSPSTNYLAIRHTGTPGNSFTVDDVVWEEKPDHVDWCNTQWPASGSITLGDAFNVYAQVYEPGITEPAGQGAGINAWIGYSTTNTNPNTWTNWVPATFNVDVGNNDEYTADIGSAIVSPGTYYYASRFELVSTGEYNYGGYNAGGGGFWDGTTNVSPELTVAFPTISLPVYEGFEDSKGFTAFDNAAGNDQDWIMNSSLMNNGSLSAHNAYTASDNNILLQTGIVDLTSATAPILQFAQIAKTEGGWDHCYVEISTDGGSTFAPIPAFAYAGNGVYATPSYNNPAGPCFDEDSYTMWGTGYQTPDNSWWKIETFDLSSYLTNNIVFRFRLDSDGSAQRDGWYLDDIYVGEAGPATAVWSGAAKSDAWETAGNWDNGVPGPNTTVTIPSGLSNYPSLSAMGFCMDLAMASDASILDNSSLVIYTDMSVERTIGADQYHSFSPSVSGETANLFHLAGSTGLNVYLYGHNEVDNANGESGYVEIVDVATALNPMQGYAVFPDGVNATPPVSDWTFTQTGDMNTGAFGSSDNLTRTGTGGFAGFNYVGNPYPSYIDWDAASGWAKANLDAATYVENSGNWAVYPYPGPPVNSGSNIIAPGQGFFVLVTDGNATGTLMMDNDVRTNSATPYLKKSDLTYVKLTASGNDKTDETVIRIDNDATLNYDSQFDALKLSAGDDSYPQIYSLTNKQIAYNAIPEVDFVQLGFHAGYDGVYTIGVSDISQVAKVWLEDTFTNTVVELSQAGYTFNYSTSDAADRFVLHFSPLAIDDNTFNNVNIYAAGQDIFVRVPASASGTIKIYNMMGQEVAAQNIDGVVNKITMTQSANYVVVVIGDDITMTEKVFVK